MHVPFSRQPSYYTCVAACTKMLLAYRGKEIPMGTVIRGIRTTKQDGATFENAGLFLVSLGHKPVVFSDETVRSKNRRLRRKELLLLIDKEIEDGDAHAHVIKEFALVGEFHPRNMTLRDILAVLAKECPVIITIRIRWKKTDMYHAMLAFGFNKKYIYYLDPTPSRKAPPEVRVRKKDFAKAMRQGTEALYIR